MTDSLVIFAGATPQEAVEWRQVRNGSGVCATGRAFFGDLADFSGASCTLLLPGDLVTAHETALAARSERQLLAAAPFAIEDQVGTELEQVHVAVAPGRKAPDGAGRVVYAVDKDLISGWTQALAQAGLQADTILPDYLALPDEADGLQIAELATRTLLRHGDWGAGVDTALGPQVLNGLIELRLTQAGPEAIRADMPLDEQLDQMAVRAAGAKWGLTRGRQPSRADGPAGLRGARLGMATSLAAAAALGWVALNLVEGYRLKAGAEAIETQTAEVFRSAFPQVERVANPRAQLRTLVRDTGTGAPDFLVLSAYVARAAEAVPAVEVASIRFDGQSDELNVSVLFKDYDALGQFRGRIEAAGGAVEEGGSRQQGDRRAGDIVVRRS